MERKLRITVDGRVYDVTVEDLSDTGSLIYPARSSMTIPAAPAAEVAAAAPASSPAVAAAVASVGPGDVVATLGGVVESVSVAVGQRVRQGQTVVVLEAMKMNSPMVAPRDGTVASLAVKAGDAVEAGRLLATIA
jgi:biotin carboxyl carrier protein